LSHLFPYSYGEAVIRSVLQDLPPADELASQRFAEARILFHEWTAHWIRQERYSQVNVRAGWVNVIGLEPATGRTTRIARLSTNGTSDVIRNVTWLDDVVSQLFHLENLPANFIPPNNETDGEQQIVRFLLVDSSADFWQSDPEPENGAVSEDDPASTEPVDGMPSHPPVTNNTNSATNNPAAVVTVEQNLARLAIVTSNSS
jgi:hypothetical protein